MWSLILSSYQGYASYLFNEILHPHWTNYFYWLIALSLGCMALEYAFPWRKNQKVLRKDFWLDAFYMFFNFFLFSLIGFNALSNVVSEGFNQLLGLFGIHNLVAISVAKLPTWVQLSIMFVLKDFLGYWIHRLLHSVEWMWRVHQVHHSVVEMGFAAHLRYHWMENLIYKSIQYLPLAMIGFGIQEFFLVHIISVAIGHLNHTNIKLPLGPLKYLLNSPQMHLWHHAREIPEPYGINFGLSLSIWDWLFGTTHWPSDSPELELGYEGMEEMPEDFMGQAKHF